MPQIIPIRDLKNTSRISELCHASDEPIFITKNGYGDMVMMSMQAYERSMMMNSIYTKLAVAEDSIISGDTENAIDALEDIRSKYGL